MRCGAFPPSALLCDGAACSYGFRETQPRQDLGARLKSLKARASAALHSSIGVHNYNFEFCNRNLNHSICLNDAHDAVYFSRSLIEYQTCRDISRRRLAALKLTLKPSLPRRRPSCA